MATGGRSLVSNILQKSSALDERILDENVQKLVKRSSQLKGEVCEILRQNYVEFQSYVDTTLTLEQKVEEVSSEYKRLSGRIEKELKGRIYQAADRREEIESRLRETEERIRFVKGLVLIYQDLESARSDIHSENLLSAANLVQEAAACLSDVGDMGCDAKVYRALKSELSSVTSDVSLELQQKWTDHIRWTPATIPDNPSTEVLSKVCLSVPASGSSLAESFAEVAKASLMMVDLWEQQVRSFSQKLLRTFLKPMIADPSLRAVTTREKDSMVLKLTRNKTREKSASERVCEVSDSLMSTLNFVSLAVSEYDKQRWAADIGELVCLEISELVIRHCLASTIPKTPSEIEQYGQISSKMEKFECDLVNLGFAIEDFHELSDYTRNINVHFAAQKCQGVLVQARVVLLQPIHDTVTVSNSTVSEHLSHLNLLPSPANLLSDDDKVRLDSLTFAFPTCTISKSVDKFVQHLYATLSESCSCGSSSLAVQLFYTARSMVDLFCAVLPSYHKTAVSEIPRIAAVQHNNFMYLAHHLITLGHQFSSKLPAPLNSETATFIDFVPLVRQLGEECFLVEMRKQSNAILDCLKTFGGFDSVSKDSKCELVRKGVRQALLQLRNLSKVYVEVLPREVHRRATGALLNTLVTAIVNGVLSLEDMASSDASELHRIITTLVQNESKTLLAPEDGEGTELLAMYCAQWEKLMELTNVLDASLVEIVERWGAGKGPLARQFNPVELRALIKAIFRNTERRADVLAHITL